MLRDKGGFDLLQTSPYPNPIWRVPRMAQEAKMYEWYERLGWSEDDEREYQERERYWHECENWNATQEARVMRLRGYGNAIVPTLAAQIIREVMKC